MASHAGSYVTAEGVFQFDTQGFLVLEEVLGRDDVAALREAAERLEDRSLYSDSECFDNIAGDRGSGVPEVLDFARTTFEGHSLRINGCVSRESLFHALIDYQPVYDYLRAFMGRPQFSHDWYIHKEHGGRSSWWHRADKPAHHFRCDRQSGQIRCRQINVGWMLDDQGAEDGALLVVPGSHKQAGPDLDLGAFPGLLMPGALPIVGKAGSVVIFTECLLHCGDRKRSLGPRRNLYFLYTDLAATDHTLPIISVAPAHQHVAAGQLPEKAIDAEQEEDSKEDRRRFMQLYGPGSSLLFGDGVRGGAFWRTLTKQQKMLCSWMEHVTAGSAPTSRAAL